MSAICTFGAYFALNSFGMSELAAHPSSPILGVLGGLAFMAIGALLFVFRKQAQALYMNTTRSRPEGKFLYVIKYVYAPVFFIFIGGLLFLASAPQVFGR